MIESAMEWAVDWDQDQKALKKKEKEERKGHIEPYQLYRAILVIVSHISHIEPS